MGNRNRKKSFMDRWLTLGQFPGSELGERDTGFRHRNYYHKYFQGYTEVRRVNARGRVVSDRYYTAPWQKHCLTDKQWVMTKIAYILGVLVSTILFLWALVQRVPSNSAAIVAAPGFLSGLLMILMWMAVFSYVTAPRKMTLWEYNSGRGKVKCFTRLAAAAILLTAVAKVVFIGVWMKFTWDGEIPGLLLLAVSAVPLILIYLAEHKMKYESLENTTVITDEERYDIQ